MLIHVVISVVMCNYAHWNIQYNTEGGIMSRECCFQPPRDHQRRDEWKNVTSLGQYSSEGRWDEPWIIYTFSTDLPVVSWCTIILCRNVDELCCNTARFWLIMVYLCSMWPTAYYACFWCPLTMRTSTRYTTSFTLNSPLEVCLGWECTISKFFLQMAIFCWQVEIAEKHTIVPHISQSTVYRTYTSSPWCHHLHCTCMQDCLPHFFPFLSILP